MPRYAAIFRVVFNEDSEAEARLAMEGLAIDMERKLELDRERGEDLRLTELVEYDLASRPEEIIALVRKTRNALIKTKTHLGWDLARQLDVAAFNWENAILSNDVNPTYDYTKFLETAKDIFEGHNPVE